MAGDYDRRMQRVIDHILGDPAGNQSLDALADVAALSRFHFHRVFRVLTGETAIQTVRRMRLNMAAAMLVEGRQGTAAIARAVGYPNRASFARAFAQAHGVPPAAYRRRGAYQPLSPAINMENRTMPDVLIRNEPARRLIAVPHRGPFHEIARAFGVLGDLATARGVIDKAEAMLAVYYDDPATVPAADLRSHAALAVPDDVPADPPFEVVNLPAGPHAIFTHRGPYEGLPAAYDRLYAVWLPQSGREPANSPVFENYLNTPMDTAPEDLSTEICLPLR